jgi:molybdenum cofactor biosynthesis enzyme MoaA
MPTNNNEWFEQNDILAYDEIVRLARILARLGIEKIRITGGEPLVRPSYSVFYICSKLVAISRIFHSEFWMTNYIHLLTFT